MRLLSLIFLLPISINAAPNIKTHKKNGLSVKVIEDNSGIPKTTIDKILDIFFSTYPKMAKEFRPTGFIKDFEFHFFPNITVSSSNGPRIRFYNKQFREDPNTLNTILHESFHSLQFSKFIKRDFCNNEHLLLASRKILFFSLRLVRPARAFNIFNIENIQGVSKVLL